MKQLSLLKAFVYFIGFALVAGSAFILYMVNKHNNTLLKTEENFNKNKSKDADLLKVIQDKVDGMQLQPQMQSKSLCTLQNSSIAVNGSVIDMKILEDKVVLVVEKDASGNYEFLVLDYCNNENIGKIEIKGANIQHKPQAKTYDMRNERYSNLR